MVDTKEFFESLTNNGVDFYCGVPDSLLKDFCAYVSDHAPAERHVITTNEGSAVALAMGNYLATNNVPLVYMQNSGFGNAINPLLSLADPKVYSIPMLLVIGWRGEPRMNDEPQHVKQGEVSETLLKTMGISYMVISNSASNIDDSVRMAITHAKDNNEPYVFLIKRGTFEPYSLRQKIQTDFDLSREQAIKKTIELVSDSDIIVATTGKTSRELFDLRENNDQGHHRDFLTVGGMGHANQIALGIAMAKPERIIYCFDGDGACLMHTGGLGIIGDLNLNNYKHIIFNNGAHDSVGGQPTIGFDIDFRKIAEGFNYRKTFQIKTVDTFDHIFNQFKNTPGPCLLEILVNKGARDTLGRPTISPKENKADFKLFLK
ncbi:phosphonopyruvate decarboxylase [Akkermansiaceae bacterium]|nr:phosphonopyruvate decarboxylase [Akkermansiaceae bacterium]